MTRLPLATPVYDSYWYFASERLMVYYRRLMGMEGPWTKDPVIGGYRFTNTYRAADRVSQYLIREVQYGAGRSSDISEIFFRTMLFKLFNRIDTWESLENRLGAISWSDTSLEAIDAALDGQLRKGCRIYSAAYIMPSPPFGKERKHSNHLALLYRMMSDRLAEKLARAQSFKAAYEHLLDYPGLGPFLAFQYAIDLNYSSILAFDESEFVVPGPGALDGISKCFVDGHRLDPVALINLMVERQDLEFSKRGLPFAGLFGRRLQPIDCQNIFCEISKYARVTHPDFSGASGRTRIKQRYQVAPNVKVPEPMFPPRWGLVGDIPPVLPVEAFGQQFTLPV